MPVLRVGEFGVPEGSYVGRFVGVVEREADPKRLGQDGRPFPPGLEWQFEIATGEHQGKTVSTITSQQPTAKNSCGRMITQMSGGSVRMLKGVEFDPDRYRGQQFNLIVEANSTGNGTKVGSVMPLQGSPAPAPPAPLGRVAPVPPPRPGMNAVSSPVEPFLWVAFGTEEAVQMTRTALQAKVSEQKLDTRDISVCSDGKNWITATQFGIKDDVPF